MASQKYLQNVIEGGRESSSGSWLSFHHSLLAQWLKEHATRIKSKVDMLGKGLSLSMFLFSFLFPYFLLLSLLSFSVFIELQLSNL
jgi:hypothetical protein